MKEQKNIENNFGIKFSFVIAIYERENELKELLESMANQTSKNFEVIVVDDGSKQCKLQNTVDLYKDKFTIEYHYKKNEGASMARNFGVSFTKGEFVLFVDSDCILPANYIQSIENKLKKESIQFFGGPDDASQEFNLTQKALSYAMTGFFTTGGIRGGVNNKNYQPRSFNMGILKSLFQKIGGFKNIDIGEDVDLSLRIKEKGIKPALIFEAKVFHKRRSNIQSFAKRVYQFGIMRPVLMQWHPASNRLVFFFPTLFLLGTIFLIASSYFSILTLIPLLIWIVGVLVESLIRYKNLFVSFLSLFKYVTSIMNIKKTCLNIKADFW